MKIISLFNGMNTGREALERRGIKVDKYYSSEIKPYAIELTQYHYPDTIQLGNILNWRNWEIEWHEIDMVLSGSPCQDLSIANRKQMGLMGEKSSLFFVFVDILNHIKEVKKKRGLAEPFFLQENVGSAPSLDVGIMSRELGVYPVRICSSLMVAQIRDRYYWTNIKTKHSIFDVISDIPQPKDRNILLKDILEHGYTDREKARTILESEGRINTCMEKMYYRYKNTGFVNIVFQINPSKQSGGKQPYQGNRVYSEKGKHACLTKSMAHREKIAFEYKGEFKIRPLTKVELCRLQGFPDNYCDIISRNHAASLLGDGWTLPIIEHIFSFLPNQ